MSKGEKMKVGDKMNAVSTFLLDRVVPAVEIAKDGVDIATAFVSLMIGKSSSTQAGLTVLVSGINICIKARRVAQLRELQHLKDLQAQLSAEKEKADEPKVWN